MYPHTEVGSSAPAQLQAQAHTGPVQPVPVSNDQTGQPDANLRAAELLMSFQGGDEMADEQGPSHGLPQSAEHEQGASNDFTSFIMLDQ